MRCYYEINCSYEEDGLHLVYTVACARCRKIFTVRVLKGFHLNDIKDEEERQLMMIGMCATCFKALNQKKIQIIKDKEYYLDIDHKEVIDGLNNSVKLGLMSQEECNKLIKEIKEKEKLKELN